MILTQLTLIKEQIYKNSTFLDDKSNTINKTDLVTNSTVSNNDRIHILFKWSWNFCLLLDYNILCWAIKQVLTDFRELKSLGIEQQIKRKMTNRNLQTWKLNNILITRVVKKKSQWKFRKYFELNNSILEFVRCT